ncbi:hypothetical protein BDV93DRAFT_363718 [Ceratobasidium sp. AG-I]|nr:hypothetical protein BDV93DRAFT_363718 [Ceratobasidium sp. AG-I]
MSESDNTRPSTSAGRPEQAQPVRSMMVPDLSKPKPDHITAEHRVLLAQRKKRDRAARVLRRALAVLQVGIIVHSEAVYPLINSNPSLTRPAQHRAPAPKSGYKTATSSIPSRPNPPWCRS